MDDRFTARDAHPVITIGGIMPGGSEMVHWYNHVPFPNPDQLALKRAELIALTEEWKAEKARLAAIAALRAA